MGRRPARAKETLAMRRVVGVVVVAGWVLLTSAGLVLTGAPTVLPTVTPAPRAETEPVPSSGDAADGPAVWVHPTYREKSLNLGTDKGGGLHVYSLDGRDLQMVGDGSRPNNVDVLYDLT